MMIWKAIKTGIATVFGEIPVVFWLAVAAIAGGLLWHFSEVREARELARLELKLSIEAEAQRTGKAADVAAQSVLACRGTWNRRLGRCEP